MLLAGTQIQTSWRGQPLSEDQRDHQKAEEGLDVENITGGESYLWHGLVLGEWLAL